jgi:hypothetical protein
MAFVQLKGGNLETTVISAAIKHVTLLLRHINNSNTASILKTMANKEVESGADLTNRSCRKR